MGLDSVELVIAIEEEFGIEIPDVEAEKLTTVGELYDYLKRVLHTTPPSQCKTQRMFYKVRKAIITNYGVPKNAITLDSRLDAFVPKQQLKDGWPYLELFSGLEFPQPEKSWWNLLGRRSADTLTLREILTAMVSLNAHLYIEPGSDEEVWTRMANVIHRQINVSMHEIQPSASFTRDLGVD